MRTINHQTLVQKMAENLKGVINPPDWADYVKTGHGKQRPPIDKDWWYVRSAAVLLSIQKLGPVGVSKLSVKYGNRKNMGMKPNKFAPGSRNILRKILQQLETTKYIKQEAKGVHKGRVLTNEGLKFINETSKSLTKSPKKSEDK